MKTLVTYAQNREDLFLHGLLGHIDKGFFVDVGAYHPELHSVTKLFTDRGWIGLNVEANARLFEKFIEERPGDINVCAAVSNVSGTIVFREYPQHDGFSTVSSGIQEIHQRSALPFVDVEVPSVTLRQLFGEHFIGKIDFLKIDVEGHEIEVLESNDWERWRPTVVTFEASRGQAAIDYMVLQNYRLEFFDGLNHYMVACEFPDISILNFADRVLHPGYLTRRETELLSQLPTPSSPRSQVPNPTHALAPAFPRSEQVGIRGAVLQLRTAIGIRARRQKPGRFVSSAFRLAKRVMPNRDPRRHLKVERSSLPRAVASDATRVETAIASRSSAVNDFFGGWTETDVELFESWRVDADPESAGAGELIDWLGCRTSLMNHPALNGPSDRPIVIAAIPIPDDQVHAEAIEYFALITSLTRAAGRPGYTVVELGASYAPWAVAAAVVATRAGFRQIHAIAVEANETTLPRIREHASRNGLTQNPIVRFDVIHAAVHTTSEPLFFPIVDTTADNGAQATNEPSDLDYRGLKQRYLKVPGVTLSTLTQHLDHVAFLHMDLQGAEENLLKDESFLDTLTEKVGVLFLATQSRLIEGIALRALAKRGWRLVRERPTTYAENERTDDINGWTLRDGAQVWLNSALRSSIR